MWEKPREDATIKDIQYVQYRPTSTLNTGPLEFSVGDFPDQFVDLAKTRLHMKIRIVEQDGTYMIVDDSTATNVAPITDILHSQFRQVDVQIQNQSTPSNVDRTYPYIAYIRTLMNESSQASATSGWYRDRQGRFDEMSGSKTNIGHLHRNVLVDDSIVLELEGGLQIDLATQDRPIINGIKMYFRFWPHYDTFRLMTPLTSKTYKIVIEEAYLRVCKITPHPKYLVLVNKTIMKEPIIYPHYRTEMRTFQMASGSTSFIKEGLFQNSIPTDMIVCMVSTDRFNGDLVKNPFLMSHNGLTGIGLTLSDIPIPSIMYKCDFGSIQFSEPYTELVKKYPDSNIALDDFDGGYAFFSFTLTETDFPISRPIKRDGTLKLSMYFKEALSHNVVIMLYARFPSAMIIDGARNVSFMDM